MLSGTGLGNLNNDTRIAARGQTEAFGDNSNIGFENIQDGIEEVLNESKFTSKTGSGTGVASTEEINICITHILDTKKKTYSQKNYNQVITAAAHLLQEGATSPKYADTKKSVEYGIEVKVSELRAGCKAAGITPRKLARGLKDVIIKVAAKHNIEGNLSKNYKLENPGYDPQELIWVSDFQTFTENPAIPENVKEWLLENYRGRFKPNSKTFSTNQSYMEKNME